MKKAYAEWHDLPRKIGMIAHAEHFQDMANVSQPPSKLSSTASKPSTRTPTAAFRRFETIPSKPRSKSLR